MMYIALPDFFSDVCKTERDLVRQCLWGILRQYEGMQLIGPPLFVDLVFTVLSTVIGQFIMSLVLATSNKK